MEDYQTDTEEEDEAVEIGEEENMRKADKLIQILGRLNELKQQGQEDDIDDKIVEVRKTLQECLSYPM